MIITDNNNNPNSNNDNNNIYIYYQYHFYDYDYFLLLFIVSIVIIVVIVYVLLIWCVISILYICTENMYIIYKKKYMYSWICFFTKVLWFWHVLTWFGMVLLHTSETCHILMCLLFLIDQSNYSGRAFHRTRDSGSSFKPLLRSATEVQRR